jgi:hypothetical protein
MALHNDSIITNTTSPFIVDINNITTTYSNLDVDVDVFDVDDDNY